MIARLRLGTLYVCYLSLDDPLVHSQVVAYLRGLAAEGHRVHLLTFDAPGIPRSRRTAMQTELARQGISWHSLRYHKRPSLPATVFDVVCGASYAAALATRYRLDVFHARSHVPAAMALMARRLRVGRRPLDLIFDVRGLMAEEYEDAGTWARGSVPFRLTKAIEGRAVARAAEIVVLTQRVRRETFAAVPSERITVIPCCADLAGMRVDVADRARAGQELGFGESPSMVYLGKLGTWYMAREMVDFFVAARDVIPGLKFAVLTQSDPAPIRDALADRRVSSNEYFIGSVASDAVPRFLAACTFGISFIRPSPSKASTSPTKIGEYLAAGLPVASTTGVGDLDFFITSELGVLVGRHSVPAYRAAAEHLAQLIGDRQTPARCRTAAHNSLSLTDVGIPRYLDLYARLAARRYSDWPTDRTAPTS